MIVFLLISDINIRSDISVYDKTICCVEWKKNSNLGRWLWSLGQYEEESGRTAGWWSFLSLTEPFSVGVKRISHVEESHSWSQNSKQPHRKKIKGWPCVFTSLFEDVSKKKKPYFSRAVNLMFIIKGILNDWAYFSWFIYCVTSEEKATELSFSGKTQTTHREPWSQTFGGKVRYLLWCLKGKVSSLRWHGPVHLSSSSCSSSADAFPSCRSVGPGGQSGGPRPLGTAGWPGG